MATDDATHGFVLNATYRVARGRPVVLLAGRLETGESFLVRDRRERPSFWIPVGARATGEAVRLGARIEATDRVSMSGEPLAEVVLERPQQVPGVRRELEAAGVRCFEADVPFATRYLIRHGIRGSLAITGPSRPAQGFDRVFDEPELAPSGWVPALRVLSIDIETDPRADRLLSIALVGCGASEVLAIRPRPDSVEPVVAGVSTHLFDAEGPLLARFVERVAALDPDVLTGWNVVGFDFAQLDHFARRARATLALGRGGSALRLDEGRGPRESLRASIPGRIVLDGIELLRGAFVRMESYALDAVAHEVLGVGKTIHGADRVAAILASWRDDLPGFITYNATDARLVLEILAQLGVVELAVARSRLTGMTLDRVAGSIASFDFLYLSELGRRGIVAPSVERGSGEDSAENFGGHVLEPRTGLHRNVVVVDFRSLYPSLIRTFELDPLGYLGGEEEGGGKGEGGREERESGGRWELLQGSRRIRSAGAIVAPNGAAFRRTPRGILPSLLDELMPRRAAAIAAGDRVASQAIKILMNSFYGVLGTSACRFYEPAIAGAITSFGRDLLLFCKERVESWGLAVLYGDTDSLFVATGEQDLDAARRVADQLPARLDAEVARYVRERWQVESRLQVERDRFYLRLHLPAARDGGGARKRYAGLADGDPPRLVIVGLEAVRRDWTDLAREAQRELYRRWFADQPIESWVRDQVERLRAGEVPEQRLVYRKGLRKPLASYTAATPPHVAAARQLDGRPGRSIRYLMTSAGPQPLGQVEAPLDLEHYVQRQLRPIAEPLLAELGLEFDRVVGDDRQLSLF